MRHWTVAVLDTTCGLKLCRIPAGAAMQELSVPGRRRKLRRCAACADGAVDWNEVELEQWRIERERRYTGQPAAARSVARVARRRPLLPLSAFADSIFDHKQAQAGERDE